MHGGFGARAEISAPASSLDLLLRRHALDGGDAEALRWRAFTLTKMAEGGLFDQLGGGFCRYSVDEYWTIPHFEKMLYDNGWLLRSTPTPGRVTREPLFARSSRRRRSG